MTQKENMWEKLNLIYSSAGLSFPMCIKTIANQTSTNLSPQFTEMFSGLDSQKRKANHEGKESYAGFN